jgi:hypothetical protein
MAKYDPLFRHLVTADATMPIEMTFDEIERLVGPLPASATKYSAWWNNEQLDTAHVQALAWLNAGRQVESVDRAARRVRFTAARWRRSS